MPHLSKTGKKSSSDLRPGPMHFATTQDGGGPKAVGLEKPKPVRTDSFSTVNDKEKK